jgi:CMP-N-acetylneuraminic acid synthetase
MKFKDVIKLHNKILAVIPARSGSKGLRNKNIMKLNGKPLIAYSIESAIKSNIFQDVIVSTDSKKYAEIAEEYGAWVPFLRPDNLSSDEAVTNDVVEDLLIKLEQNGKKYDFVMILQPTSPLRDDKDIIDALNFFVSKKANSVISMCECEHPPIWTKELGEDLSLDGFLGNLSTKRRQELHTYYRINGAIYLYKVEYFLKYKNLYHNKSYAFIMDKNKSIDIDDLYDFTIAEVLMNIINK